jgi:type VI secretion system protein ImpH
MTPADIDALKGLNYFKLASQIERLVPDAPPIGSTAAPRREVVRFRANATLGFPAGEIAAISLRGTEPVRLDVFVNLLGLHGPSSPLPPHYTERVMHADGTSTVGDFLDFFNHRLLGLLYQSWKNQRHELRFESGGRDRTSTAMAALMGLPVHPEDMEDARRRVTLLPYVGLLCLHNRSQRALAAVVAHFFGCACHIEEFVPRDVPIPEDSRVALGRLGQLGVDCVVGETVADVTSQFILGMGPLSLAEFEAMLPGRPGHAQLETLVQLVIADPLLWRLRLTIAPGEAKPWRLGAAELGWSSWAEPPVDRPVEILL